MSFICCSAWFPIQNETHNNKRGWLGHNKKNRIIECETSRVTEPGTDNLEEQNRTLRRLIWKKNFVPMDTE